MHTANPATVERQAAVDDVCSVGFCDVLVVAGCFTWSTVEPKASSAGISAGERTLIMAPTGAFLLAA
jgi:hypothetical protein